MNICVLGTARSGTTAIYSLLQKIVKDNADQVDYFYEPFLWQIETFDDLYENVRSLFDLTGSLSHEGIYHHLNLPMFIEKPEEYSTNSYLNRIFSNEENRTKLIKIIRGNGRVKLFHKLDPDCRFIITIRNPLDVVNSINNKFSFYGGEFHYDDYRRFCGEAQKVFQVNMNPVVSATYLEKQLLYWKYMNRFMLQAFEDENSKTLMICQEDLSSHPSLQAERVCKFLELPVRNEYLTAASERKSEVTKKFILSQRELDFIMPYMDEYFELLKRYDIPCTVDRKTITGKYQVAENDLIQEPGNYGKSPLHLMAQIKTLSRVNKELRNEKNELMKENKALLNESERVNSKIERIIKSKTQMNSEKDSPVKNLSKLEKMLSNPWCRFMSLFHKEKK